MLNRGRTPLLAQGPSLCIYWCMPSRNILKHYAPDTTYHVYSRGVNKQPIFLDDQDYTYFLSLFKRYLTPKSQRKTNHLRYTVFTGQVELLAYCLMKNHYHLLIHQYGDTEAITMLMRRINTSYSMYFNQKYNRVGPVFQSRYLASPISSEPYLWHISRYIHLNPKQWRSYQYSSIRYYLDNVRAAWLNPSRVLDLIGGPTKYQAFVADYEDYKAVLDDVHDELAHQ